MHFGVGPYSEYNSFSGLGCVLVRSRTPSVRTRACLSARPATSTACHTLHTRTLSSAFLRSFLSEPLWMDGSLRWRSAVFGARMGCMYASSYVGMYLMRCNSECVRVATCAVQSASALTALLYHTHPAIAIAPAGGVRGCMCVAGRLATGRAVWCVRTYMQRTHMYTKVVGFRSPRSRFRVSAHVCVCGSAAVSPWVRP